MAFLEAFFINYVKNYFLSVKIIFSVLELGSDLFMQLYPDKYKICSEMMNFKDFFNAYKDKSDLGYRSENF